MFAERITEGQKQLAERLRPIIAKRIDVLQQFNHPETVPIIIKYYCNKLISIVEFSPTLSDTIQLIDKAVFLHRENVQRFTDKHELTIGQPLQDTNLFEGVNYHENIYVAFGKSLIPKVIKFSEHAKYEYECFQHLGITMEEVRSHHLVPIERFIEDIEIHQTAIVMPLYCCSTSSLEFAYIKTHRNTIFPFEEVEKLWTERLPHIKDAVDMLHSKGVFHNDIKSSNILIDNQGEWYLGEYGGCWYEASSNPYVSYTKQMLPSDWTERDIKSKLNSREFDYLLLVVTVFVFTNRLSFMNKFTMNDIHQAMNEIVNVELKEMLQPLLMY